MVLSLFSGVTLPTNAATYTTPPTVNSSYVTARLEKLAEILEGEYFTTTGQTCTSASGSCSLEHDVAHNEKVIASDWFKGKFPELSNLNITQLPKHYLDDTTSRYKGWHCFGFACFAQWYACSAKSTDYLTGELLYSGTYSGDLIKNTCAPGDVIRYGGHSAVIYSIGETTFKVIDCNYTASGTYPASIIRVREINYTTSAFYKEGGNIWISRTANSDPDYVGVDYDRDAAVAYADENWDNNTKDNQCANFASNCLRAGGVPMSSNKAVTVDLRDYLVNNGYATQIKLSSKNYQEGVLEKGDVIYIQCTDYDDSGNVLKTHYPHVYVCDGKNSSGVATASAWSSNRNKVTTWWWSDSQWQTNCSGHHSSTSSAKFTFYSLHINTIVDDSDDTSSDTSSDTTTPSTKTQYRYGAYVAKGYDDGRHFCPKAGAYWAEYENKAWAGQSWSIQYYNQSVNDGWSDTRQDVTIPYYNFQYCDVCNSDEHHTINGKTYYKLHNGKKYWDYYKLDGKRYYWEETRTVCVVHDYSNDCDTTCNRSGCGATRTITHTYDSSTDPTCNVCGATRNISVTGVTLNKTTASLNIGETVTLTATVSPSTATNKNVTWSSNNTTVATVSNGVVTAKAAGTATITVKTADGSKTATCTVTVKQPILASGECGKNGDNITWTLKDTGELIISGSGEMADYSNQMNVPWYSNNSKVKSITFEGNITSIGDCTFAGLANVKSISIPSTVTKIGNYAFNAMTGITSITLGQNIQSVGVYAFEGCTNLSSVTLHDNISKIGGYAFQDCDSLVTITLPSSITSIGDYIFYSCDKLKTINIPESVTTIGDKAFAFCTSLEDIKLPSKVTVVNANTFQGCTALTEIDFLDNIISIEAYAFSKCTNITKVTLPKNVTEIKSGAFSECTNITDVYYGGTTTDKANINIGSLNNSYLINATWHCQEEENIPDENAPQIVVESKTVVAGDQIQVTVSVKNNPGIAGLAVSLKYDETALTLDGVKKGTLFSGFTSGKNFAWDESENVTEDGVLATFTFTVSETASTGDYTIEIIPRSCTNEDLDDVELFVINGTVTVIDFIYGDANGDQEIDMKDVVILRKYITNYDYDIETSSVEVGRGADANGDGDIDMKDVVILRKYITNYDYDTGSSTVVLGPQQ